ncbi:Ig-like domain-containing protein [Undibacterium arcticum]
MVIVLMREAPESKPDATFTRCMYGSEQTIVIERRIRGQRRMTSAPVDPILTWKKTRPGFAIVVKHVKGEPLIQRISGRTRKGSADHQCLAGSNEKGKQMNRFECLVKPLTWFMALLLAAFVAGCGANGDGGTTTAGTSTSASLLARTTVVAGVPGIPGASTTDPSVGFASPSNGSINVPTSTNSSNNLVTATVVSATFSQPMDPATLNSSPAGTLLTFTLKETTGNNVPGTVSMNAANTVATFTPTASALTPKTSYTATVTTAAKNAGGTQMAIPVVWSFTTKAVASTVQAPVKPWYSRYFRDSEQNRDHRRLCICHYWGCWNEPHHRCRSPSHVRGSDGKKIYVVDAAGPLPCAVNDATSLTAAVGDMGTAYLDAEGRTSPPILLNWAPVRLVGSPLLLVSTNGVPIS